VATGLDPREEGGVVALMVLLSLFVVFGMVVLVVDLGALIVKHRGLVNANDSAALAAADSFARNEGDTASTQADRFARENVPDAEHDTDWWTVTSGLDSSGCLPSTCGSVRVRYQAGQALFFAPALGLSDHVTAHATATAIWGPAGGGHPIPVTVELERLAECGVPNSEPAPRCGLWLDASGGGDGEDPSANWAWLNLDRWNVEEGSSCPRISRPILRGWIEGQDVPLVRVNPPPNPTFVCTWSDRPSRYFDQLSDQVGRFRIFPVNDTTGEFVRPAEVGDKDNVVGFTPLRIEEVLHGDDPAASGKRGGPVDCSWKHVDLEQGHPLFLADQSCQWEDLHYPDAPGKPFPAIHKGEKNYEGDVIGRCETLDYCYDPTTSEITWLLPDPVKNATVEWQYDVPDMEGACGVRDPSDAAVCLVVSWQGYRTGGINPGTGIDFGLRAVRLSE
jgi:putative Flp pilus-assembly TadE/G-like protein